MTNTAAALAAANTATAENLQTLTDRDLFIHFAAVNSDMEMLAGNAYDDATVFMNLLEAEINRRFGADATDNLSEHLMGWHFSAQDLIDAAEGDHEALIDAAKGKQA
jgi:hypothetical protein